VLTAVRTNVAVLRGSKSAQPGGLSTDQTARLAEAAKTVPASLPHGRFVGATPDEPQVGKTYGIQLLGRTANGVPYATMASVRLDAVTDNEVSGVVVANSDGIGVDGKVVITAGSVVKRPVKAARGKAAVAQPGGK
jgi:hypothetical protein